MHIVLFIGGEFPDPRLTENYLSKTGSPDFIVAADSGLDTLSKYDAHYTKTSLNINFYPDIIVGDMDSIQDKSLPKKYSHAITQAFPCDKDYTDTELALSFCSGELKRTGGIITMVGGNGGRADHFISIYETYATECHPDVWLCGKQAIYYLDREDSISFSGLSESDNISIARLPSNYFGGHVETEGLEWGSAVMRKKGMPSLSNRISKEFLESGKNVKITAQDGQFLVFAPVDCPAEHYTRNPKPQPKEKRPRTLK